MFDTIYSLGSRCQNSLILKEYKLRDFSGFFDFMNIEKVSILKHILEDDFNEFFKSENINTFDFSITTYDPETNEMLPHSIRSSNKFYQPDDYLNSHYALCPHYDLKNQKDVDHLLRCVRRFKNLKHFNPILNYTYNSWENDITEDDIKTIDYLLKTKYNFENFKVVYVKLIKSNLSSFNLTKEDKNFDIWELNIKHNSFTGGLFSNAIDNENFIDIIRQYKLSENRITKHQIDSIDE
jgi:hypothetical protein